MKLFTRSLKALATAGAVAVAAFTFSGCGDDDDSPYNNFAYIPEFIEGFQIQGAIVKSGDSQEFYATPIVGLTFLDDVNVRIRYQDGSEIDTTYVYDVTTIDPDTGEALEGAVEIDVPQTMITEPTESGSFYYIVINEAQADFQVNLGTFSAYYRGFTGVTEYDEIPLHAQNGTLTLIEL